jgi:hypothetical protein
MHIVRYEDIVKFPKQTLEDIVKFILNTSDIKGSNIESYIDLAVQEASPQIYKPREGKVNGNLQKFSN